MWSTGVRGRVMRPSCFVTDPNVVGNSQHDGERVRYADGPSVYPAIRKSIPTVGAADAADLSFTPAANS